MNEHAQANEYAQTQTQTRKHTRARKEPTYRRPTDIPASRKTRSFSDSTQIIWVTETRRGNGNVRKQVSGHTHPYSQESLIERAQGCIRSTAWTDVSVEARVREGNCGLSFDRERWDEIAEGDA